MTLIRSIQLINFRGFREHTVSLDSLSILVGQNNAGKSTFIDAVRLLAVAVRKAGSANFSAPPEWLDGEASGLGFRVSFETVDFDFSNILFNNEQEGFAKLQILYHNRSRVTLWLNATNGQNYTQVNVLGQELARTRADVARADLSAILVLPPISQLARKETQIDEARVKEHMYGRLAGRHFRNQLSLLPDAYSHWHELLRQTWPTVLVTSFNGSRRDNGQKLSLILREGPFVAEAAAAGSGLQAWMQILWFICRAETSAFVVLDEPDVFLHADMQRKIVKIIAGKQFEQVAIATHSPEIISDVEPASINVIRKRERYSSKPGKRADVQRIMDQLGSRHNIQIGKLAAARKVVLYEGDDQKLISQIALLIGDSQYQKFMAVPYFDIQGVDNWHQAIGAARTLHASTDGSIPAFLIIDRDYRSNAELQEIKDECDKYGLRFRHWNKKEIENYFVLAGPVSRLVTRRSKKGLSPDEAQTIIDEGANILIEYTIDAITDRWQLANSRSMASTARAEAKKIFGDFVKERPLCDIISGKRLIAEISKITQARYGAQVNTMALCRECRLGELDKEIVDLTTLLAS